MRWRLLRWFTRPSPLQTPRLPPATARVLPVDLHAVPLRYDEVERPPGSAIGAPRCTLVVRAEIHVTRIEIVDIHSRPDDIARPGAAPHALVPFPNEMRMRVPAAHTAISKDLFAADNPEGGGLPLYILLGRGDSGIRTWSLEQGSEA